MLRIKTRTEGRKYPRRAHWIQQRDKAFARAGEKCEISGDPLRVLRHGEDCMGDNCVRYHCKLVWKRAVDHLFPERWVRRWMPGADPHITENLFCVSMRVHSMKTGVERRIYSADVIGYYTELRRIGFAQEMIDTALKALNASIKEKKK